MFDRSVFGCSIIRRTNIIARMKPLYRIKLLGGQLDGLYYSALAPWNGTTKELAELFDHKRARKIQCHLKRRGIEQASDLEQATALPVAPQTALPTAISAQPAPAALCCKPVPSTANSVARPPGHHSA